ncbi:hypothetical protein KI387_011038, partial [Taxus chinensis]
MLRKMQIRLIDVEEDCKKEFVLRDDVNDVEEEMFVFGYGWVQYQSRIREVRKPYPYMARRYAHPSSRGRVSGNTACWCSDVVVCELGGNNTAVEREKVLLQELMSVVNGMLRNAEVAVRSFMIIQPRFIRPAASSNAQPPTTASAPTNFPNLTASQMSTSVTSMMDFYSGFPKKPSPFLQQTVAKFERQLTECRQWIEELERLLLPASDDTRGSSSDPSLLQSLPSVISNIHDFFIYVAAEVETLHQRIESMRAAYLADQRRRGDESDPFLEADRRELAKREAAAKRVHPALQSSFSQPSTQVTGLFTSSAAPATAFSGMSHSTQSSQGALSSSSGAGFSMFNTPASSSSSSSFLFSTPIASATGASVFGSSAAPQTQTVFGSSPTPSIFGANTSSSLTSGTGSGSSLSMFSMPAFSTGSTSGSLFGASSGSSSSLFGSSPSPSIGLVGGGAGNASGSSFGTNP